MPQAPFWTSLAYWAEQQGIFRPPEAWRSPCLYVKGPHSSRPNVPPLCMGFLPWSFLKAPLLSSAHCLEPTRPGELQGIQSAGGEKSPSKKPLLVLEQSINYGRDWSRSLSMMSMYSSELWVQGHLWVAPFLNKFSWSMFVLCLQTPLFCLYFYLFNFLKVCLILKDFILF